LVIGVVETLSVAYWSASYRDALVYAILIAVLLFRPQGLFGVRTHEERI
jgi:branched-chain amino acid transport system permease protein